MLGMFKDFSVYFKLKKSYIDNTTFRLHYKITFAFLIIASFLTTANNIIGSNIRCLVDGVPSDIMDSYCWIQGTFTIPSQLTGRVGTDVAHPGVAPPTGSNLRTPGISYRYKAGPLSTEELRGGDSNLIRLTDDGDEIRHAWYQWVCLVLFLQAVLCYVPHYMWKCWEAGKLSMLIQGLDEPCLDENAEKDRRTNVVDYFQRTHRTHNTYAFKFIFCELLNLVNILFQAYFMDVFLGYQFTTYGLDVLKVSGLPIEDRFDPMAKVFPKVTKCTFHQYGPSGTVENKDGLCVLAVNIINEKIYIFLWFWYIVLIIWTSIHLLTRIVELVSKNCRHLLLRNRYSSSNRADINVVTRNCNYGDWFLLMQMAKHLNPESFHRIMLDLRDKIDQRRGSKKV